MKRKDVDIDELLKQYFRSRTVEPPAGAMEAAREPMLQRIKDAAFAKDAALPLTRLEHQVLTATCLLPEPGYGMVIWKKLNESAATPVALSSVYTALDTMEDRGLVTSWIDKMRYFKLTPVGERALAEARVSDLASDPADDSLGDLA